MAVNSNKVYIEMLRKLYSEDSSARAVLDHFASRERNWGTTTVDRIHRNLLNEGQNISRREVIGVFRELENWGCGSFMIGRKGWKSRFEWNVQMVGVGQAAAGETEQVEKVSPEEAGEENEGNSLFKHTFRLRYDQSVTVELPVDLTAQEAVRMARFIETLPFQGDTIDRAS